MECVCALGRYSLEESISLPAVHKLNLFFHFAITWLRCLCQLMFTCSLVVVFSLWTHSLAALHPFCFSLSVYICSQGEFKLLFFDSSIKLSVSVVPVDKATLSDVITLTWLLKKDWSELTISGNHRLIHIEQGRSAILGVYFADIGYSGKGEANQMLQIMQ